MSGDLYDCGQLLAETPYSLPTFSSLLLLCFHLTVIQQWGIHEILLYQATWLFHTLPILTSQSPSGVEFTRLTLEM